MCCFIKTNKEPLETLINKSGNDRVPVYLIKDSYVYSTLGQNFNDCVPYDTQQTYGTGGGTGRTEEHPTNFGEGTDGCSEGRVGTRP